jgi:hypothetical protein
MAGGGTEKIELKVRQGGAFAAAVVPVAGLGTGF